MKHGDFTLLAAEYINRPGYALEALDIIAAYVKKTIGKDKLIVADVGAGTGKLTENLSQLGFLGYAVEPNDAMRGEGIKYTEGMPFVWSKGTAEVTGLPPGSVDWVLMGSSFHWADTPVALEEFARILTPGGFFTAIWNPRDIEKSELHRSIEEEIHKIVPKINRVSSGSSKNMKDMDEKILSTKYFDNLFFMEVPFKEIMTKERYMGAWRSVNDIRVQAGEERFAQILDMIAAKVAPYDTIEVPYKARSWTVRAVI